MRTLDVTVTVGYLKGVTVGDRFIQAVWEAFHLPHQTELQRVTPLFDGGGNFGVVTWNESFEIHDVAVESESVECFLEIAFWQYLDPEEDPTAIGFKRINISGFHKRPALPISFSLDIEGQDSQAEAYIQITSRPSKEVATVQSNGQTEKFSEKHHFIGQQQVDATLKEQKELLEQKAFEHSQQELKEQEKEKRELEESRRQQELEKMALEQQLLQEKAKKQEIAKTKATTPTKELVQDSTRNLIVNTESKVKELNDDIIFMTPTEKSDIFRSILKSYCNFYVGAVSDSQPISKCLDVSEDGFPLEAIVDGILQEAIINKDHLDVEKDLKEKLMFQLLSFYVRRLPNGRDLASQFEHQAMKCVSKLLRFPSSLSAHCFNDYHSSLNCVFKVAQQHGMNLSIDKDASSKLVFYHRADKQFVLDGCFLSHVIVRAVPVTEQQTVDMQTLVEMVENDVKAGNVPTLYYMHVGLDGKEFCDNSSECHSLCKKHNMILHLEGPGLFLAMTKYSETDKILNAINDPDLCVTISLVTHQIFLFSGSFVGCHMTFLRVPDTDSHFTSHASLSNTISLYVRFKSQGLSSIRNPTQHKIDEATYLLSSLAMLDCVQLLTSPNNLYHVRFRFCLKDANPTTLNETNRMLHQLFLTGFSSSTDTLNTLQIHTTDVPSMMSYFEYSLISSDIDQVTTDRLIALFKACSASLISVQQYSGTLQEGIKQFEQLHMLADLSRTPFALACFRLIPPFYASIDRKTESHFKDLNSINSKLGSILQEEDRAFQSTSVNNQTFVLVTCDPAMTITFTDQYVNDLIQKITTAVTKMENDDEILSRIQAEITKRGIEVAEKQLMQLKVIEDSQESVLRLLPVIGPITNWWAPADKEIGESMSFDLRTSTLTKQVAKRKDATPRAGILNK